MPPALLIAPSLLAADFCCLGADASRALEASADWLHCDVMDGVYVPNLSFGPSTVAALRRSLGAAAFLDCHVMVQDPGAYVPRLADAGASQFTFHFEGTVDPAGVAASARAAGMRVGLALSPPTPADAAFALADAGALDMVLVMTVTPGFGGQKFMADVLPKVAALRARYPALDIQVDGGVWSGTVGAAAAAGANVAVAGSSVFGAPGGVAAAIAGLREAMAAAVAAATPTEAAVAAPAEQA